MRTLTQIIKTLDVKMSKIKIFEKLWRLGKEYNQHHIKASSYPCLRLLPWVQTRAKCQTEQHLVTNQKDIFLFPPSTMKGKNDYKYHS